MKVFLSHSTKDQQFVQTLAAELEAEQIEPWLASFPDPLAAPRGQILQVAAKGACDFNPGIK